MPQETKTYSFKSSGLTKQTELSLSPVDVKNPLGIKTPLQFSDFDEGDLFRMHKDLGDLLVDNFRNMILTNHGERMVHYDFGANLRELTFELGSENIDSEAMARISATTSKYMPYISLTNFAVLDKSSDTDHESLAPSTIAVGFDIPDLNIYNKQINVTIFAGG